MKAGAYPGFPRQTCQRAAGDVAALIGFGQRYGFEVEAVPAVVDPASGTEEMLVLIDPMTLLRS